VYFVGVVWRIGNR